jgi:hypothetical protein
MINTGDMTILRRSVKERQVAYIWDEHSEDYISRAHIISHTTIMLVLGQEPMRVTRSGLKIDTSEWASILIDNLIATVRFDWLKTL